MSMQQMEALTTIAKNKGLDINKMSIKDFISFSKTIKL